MNTSNNHTYQEGLSFPKSVLFDKERMKRLYQRKWFFVGTRGDVPYVGDYFSFSLFDNSYFLVHGKDGVIRCMVNRCAHQSARLVNQPTGKFSAKIICPNHQWSFELNDGSLYRASRMPEGFAQSDEGKKCGLDCISLREVEGLLFACLGDEEDVKKGADDIQQLIAPYLSGYHLAKKGYKLAYHERVEVPANWLIIMLNNRECCHCQVNHKGLLNLFSDSSFNGSQDDAEYMDLLEEATKRWESRGLAWKEQAFDIHDSCRIARYPMRTGYKSISFDGNPCCAKLIGPHKDYDESTLSFWFNPNAWLHFTSDHISTNWILPLDEYKSILYTSWIVHEDAQEGVDYSYQQMTDVWKVTNKEDEALCQSMSLGAQTDYYKPGFFSADERHCRQFCNWYMKYSEK